MEVGLIVPDAFLEVTRLSRYHLVLNHRVQESDLYRNWYRGLSSEGHFIILDNSAHELGTGVDGQVLYDAARAVRASEVVLPDRLFWGADTVELSTAAADEFLQQSRGGFLYQFMVVPQGRTVWEWFECLVKLGSIPGVRTIGISKDYSTWPGGLEFLVQLVSLVAPTLAIHLLGYPRDGTGVRESSHSLVRGIDSAKPAVAAFEGEEWSLGGYTGHRPWGFFDLDETQIDSSLLVKNLESFVQAFGSSL